MAAEIYSRKQRSNRAVLAGVVMIATAFLLDWLAFAPLVVTTFGALAGLVLLMYGVYAGWSIFYERESDGPAS